MEREREMCFIVIIIIIFFIQQISKNHQPLYKNPIRVLKSIYSSKDMCLIQIKEWNNNDHFNFDTVIHIYFCLLFSFSLNVCYPRILYDYVHFWNFLHEVSPIFHTGCMEFKYHLHRRFCDNNKVIFINPMPISL